MKPKETKTEPKTENKEEEVKLVFEEYTGTTRATIKYDYEKFKRTIAKAKTYANDKGFNRGVKVKWEQVARIIGAHNKIHSFLARKSDPIFDNGKTIRDIENELRVLLGGDRKEGKLVVKPA